MSTATPRRSITRNLELEALQKAVRWPAADARSAMVLAGQLLASRRDQDGFDYFRERAATRPDEPLFTALEGLFQARLARRQPPAGQPATLQEALRKLDDAVSRGPGMAMYLRGIVQSELPPELGRAETAIADLEWVLAAGKQFPSGLRRNAHRALARAYGALGREAEAQAALQRSGYAAAGADEPVLVTDSWLTARDGFRFVQPRLVEPAPGVYVAQGYDFGDFAFVETGDGIVAIDAGTADANVHAALRALREITAAPIRTVILTHSHWDHIGGLGALRDGGVEVIAQANFRDQLRIVRELPLPWPAFFGTEAGAAPAPHVIPDRLVSAREVLTVGGVELTLYPVHGGETADGLVVHMPATGVVFVGDVMMPYLGAPFMPEGSPEGLFEAIRLIKELQPDILIHGHTGLTEAFTIAALPAVEAALHDLYAHVKEGVGQGRTMVEIVHDNHLPDALRDYPPAVLPYLVTRENFIKRVYHQRTGYWKPDGEGIEAFAPDEWAAALDLLGGGREEAFTGAADHLLEQADDALALRLVDLGLLRHPASQRLSALRRRALSALRERYQQLNPFKFIVYSGWADAELAPPD